MTALEALHEAVGEEGLRALFPYPNWVRLEVSQTEVKEQIFFHWRLLPDDSPFHAKILRLIGNLVTKDQDGELWKVSVAYDDGRLHPTGYRDGWRPAVFLIVKSEQGEHVLRVPYRFAYKSPPVKQAIAWTFRNSNYNPKVQT